VTARIDEATRIAIAAAHDAGAEDVEVSWVNTESEFVRFASSRFTQVGRTEQLTLRVRAIADGRMGTQLCASAERAEVERAARAAVEVAGVSPRLDVALAFASPATAGSVPSGPDAPAIPDAWTAEHSPARLRRAFDRAGDARFAGSLKSSRRMLGVDTAAGVVRRFAQTRAELGLIASTDGSSGFASEMGRVDAGSGTTTDMDIDRAVSRARDTGCAGAIRWTWNRAPTTLCWRRRRSPS
jgi:predicted Zn-dependent protease